MMEELIFSLNATVPIFLVMIVGYVAKQIKMVDEHFVKVLNAVNFKITLPVLVFRDIATSDFYQVWDTTYVLFCFFATLISIVVIGMGCKFFYKDKFQTGEMIQASYRSSAAVLGIAFIQNIYGTSGMAPLMIIGTVPLYNVAAVIILTFTSEEKGTDAKEAIKKSILGVLTNPIILGILLGLLVSLLRIRMPVIVSKTVNNFAVLASPLALFGLGAGFEGRKALKEIKPTIVATLIKLVILPAVFLPAAIYLGFTTEKLVAVLIMLGAPTTASCYVMAKNMGHKGILTSSIVVSTTFFCSVTLTFWLYVLRCMGYV
ncbi:MAG: AEC family transporter [Thermoflexaceae bacterium]|nr:AEC family transporter [Thermoflexaceae bacterium]